MTAFVRFFIAALALILGAPAVRAQNTTAPSPSVAEIREAMKSQLPAPPEGFTWQLFKNAVFLKPTGWNERQRAEGMMGMPISTYAASPEDFSKVKQFEMGVTLKITSNPGKTIKLEAKKLAFAYLKPVLDSHKKEEILMLEQSTEGDFQRIYFRYRDAPPGLKPIIAHWFVLANNVTDSVHQFIFESPADTWDENWKKYGTPIIGKLNVVPGMPSQ